VDAALLAGEEDPERLRCIVAAVALVGVDPLDLAPRERLRLLDGSRSSAAPWCPR